MDVALPADATVAEAVDELSGRLLPGAPLAPDADGSWYLHRLGRRPFHPGTRLRDAGLRDGESLHLSPWPMPRPAEPVDDGLVALAEGASAVRRWSTHAVGVLVATVLVATSTVTALLTLALPGGPLIPLLLAGLLLGLAGGLRGRGSDDLPVLGAGLASLPAWAAGGVAAARTVGPTVAVTLTLAGAALAVGSALAWLLAPGRGPWWSFTGTTAGGLAVSAALTAGEVLPAPRAVAVVATVWLVALVAMPWLLTRSRGWLDPDPSGAGHDLTARAARTRRTVDAVALAGGLTVAVVALLLAPRGDGLTLGFVAAVSVTLALRARRSVFVVESASALGAGLVGLAAVGFGLVSGGSPTVRAVVVAVAILTVGALVGLSAAVRAAGAGEGGLLVWWQRPRTRRTLDWLEVVTALAVLPLLAGVLGVYTAAADAGARL